MLPSGGFRVILPTGVSRSVDEAFLFPFEVTGNDADMEEAERGRMHTRDWADLPHRLSAADGQQSVQQVMAALGRVLIDGTRADAGRRQAADEHLAKFHALLADLGIDLGDALDDLPDRFAALRKQLEATNDAAAIANRLDRLAEEIGGDAPALADVARGAAAKFRPADGEGSGSSNGDPAQ